MKFLQDLVSCWRPVLRPKVPTTPPRTIEMRSVMRLSSTGNHGFSSPKRGRITGSNKVSVAQWQPSLGSISEDNVVYVVPGKTQGTIGTEKKLTNKAGSKAKVRVRSHSVEFRRAPVPAVIPTFSPTPFLF